MKRSFSEKSSRVQIVALTVVLLLYIRTAYANYADGFTSVAGNVALLIWSCVTLTVLLIVGFIYTAATTKPEAHDERDRLIHYRAKATTSCLYGTGCVLSILGLALSVNPLFVIHLLMSTLFLTSIIGEGMKLYYDKRGF
jgi:cytochrome b561